VTRDDAGAEQNANVYIGAKSKELQPTRNLGIVVGSTAGSETEHGPERNLAHYYSRLKHLWTFWQKIGNEQARSFFVSFYAFSAVSFTLFPLGL